MADRVVVCPAGGCKVELEQGEDEYDALQRHIEISHRGQIPKPPYRRPNLEKKAMESLEDLGRFMKKLDDPFVRAYRKRPAKKLPEIGSYHRW